MRTTCQKGALCLVAIFLYQGATARENSSNPLTDFEFSYRTSGCQIRVEYRSTLELLADDRASIASALFIKFAESNYFNELMSQVDAHEPVEIPHAIVDEVGRILSLAGMLAPLEAEFSGLLDFELKRATAACRLDVTDKAHAKATARKNQLQRAADFVFTDNANLIERGLITICDAELTELVSLDPAQLAQVRDFAFESGLKLAAQSGDHGSSWTANGQGARLCILGKASDPRVMIILVNQLPNMRNDDAWNYWILHGHFSSWMRYLRGQGERGKSALPKLNEVFQFLASQKPDANVTRYAIDTLLTIVHLEQENSLSMLNQLLYHENAAVSEAAEKMIFDIEGGVFEK